MPKPSTNIDLTGIASVLKNNRLSVPLHQRSFEWGVEVQEFLDDIGGAFGRNKEEYFLGSLVIIGGSEGKRPQVLDGQQRLATVSILLAGIADRLEEEGDNNRAIAVREQFLDTFDFAAGMDSPQLKLNVMDDPYFKILLKHHYDEPTRDAPESHRNLYKARIFIRDWLNANLEKSANKIQWLTDWITYLMESAYVVYFTVPDDANAYLIFETMNDRGLDLSIADLLKNYLMGRGGAENLGAIINLWARAIGYLNAYGGENIFSSFLRHFWSSKYELVREKYLYRNIKSRIISPVHVMDFSNELSRNSYLYAAILSPEHEFWTDASPKARDRIRTLSLLGLEQYRPMLLAALAHMKIEEVEEILRLLTSWNVRLLIVGGLGSGALESRYAGLGQGIRNGELKSISEITNRAKEFIPSDSVFKENFKYARVTKVKLSRYYLSVLERQASGESQPELLPNVDPGELTLEHILPERSQENWPQFSDEDKDAYVKRIGNMVLLKQKLNNKIRSAPFDEKRKIFEASNLKLTAMVAKDSKWTKTTVEARQEYLADLAVKAWSI